VTQHRSPAESLHIGGYDIFDEIASAPGTTFVRACGPGGRSVMLQLAFCRAPRSSADAAAWFEMTQRIASATAEVRRSLLPGILEHGIAPQQSGVNVLFWVLPWHDAIARLGKAEDRVRTVDDLLALANDLLEILVARHDAGWVEPLLSESTIIVGSGEPARIAGAPFFVDREWEALEHCPARRAPEEIVRKGPTRSGDLWRLGRTLSALARDRDLPGSVRALIDSLSSADPRHRPASAQAALANLQRIVRGRISVLHWSDPDVEEPTLPSVPVPRGIDVAARFLRETPPDGVGKKTREDRAREAAARRPRSERKSRALTIAVEALGVFVASALLTLGALEVLS
jgi:hypothetical protein